MEAGGWQRDLVKSGTECRDERADAASVTLGQRGALLSSEERPEGGASHATAPPAHLRREEPVENQLPERAAQVFAPAPARGPAVSSPTEKQELWEMESQKSPLLLPQATAHSYHQQGFGLAGDEAPPPSTCGWPLWFVCGGRAAL